MSIEHEAKLVAPPEFELPELDDLIAGIVAAPAVRRRLDAVYYDSADLALARCGATLRYRTGEGAPVWTLKLPDGQSASALVRHELVFDGEPGTPPLPARDLVRGYLRSRPLKRVARLRTIRTTIELRDQSGAPIAEVVDDVVSAYRGRRQTATFREVEVELSGERRQEEDLLHAAVARLVTAGCHAEPPIPKLVRALGSAATAPADIVLPDLGDRPTVAGLIRHTLARSVARLVRHDAGVRLGDDPENVHQFRVATRRLRSDLHTFASVLDHDWVRSLRAELRWLAGEVGAVRDNDVLTDRLRTQGAALPDQDAGVVALLLNRLGDQGQRARTSMLDALRSSRYDALLDALVAATKRPTLAATATDSADRPAGQLVTGVVRRQWRRLRKAVDALGDPPSDTDLHQVRILAKRCRYAAEMAIPVAGPHACRFAAALADIQGVLGDHHDAIVAEEWLRAAAIAVPDSALAAGELITVQRAENARLRAAWPAAWRSASAKKLVATPGQLRG